MRLINQAGTMSFNFDDYVLMLDIEALLLCDKDGETTYVLGTFDTAKRASEVFDAINSMHTSLACYHIPWK